MKKILFGLVLPILLVLVASQTNLFNNKTDLPKESVLPQPAETPLPTASPSPKPLTFKEANALWGPCVYLPVLMYHHVQPPETAKENKQTSISVDSEVFGQQINYLKSKGYTTITPSKLAAFFESGAPIPPKGIIITFDDGYRDFYTNALSVLESAGFQAVVFLATGLVDNSGYLSWSEIATAGQKGIYFGNHTWSHTAVGESDVFQKEVVTAESQLGERGLNADKIFAYPYGSYSESSQKILRQMGFRLAFGTGGGSLQCAQQRFNLRRIRVGNVGLENYGF